MKWICVKCTSEHDEEPARCLVCGAKVTWFQPSQDEILQACQEIQATWTRTEERRRQSIRSPRVDFAVCVWLRRSSRKKIAGGD